MKNSGFSAPFQTIIVFCPVPNALAKDIYITRIARINVVMESRCRTLSKYLMGCVNPIEDWAFSWGFNDPPS